MKGLFNDAAKLLPKLKPTDKQTIKPGPAVDATQSISSILHFRFINGFFFEQSNQFFLCELAANSGTTPPYCL